MNSTQSLYDTDNQFQGIDFIKIEQLFDKSFAKEFPMLLEVFRLLDPILLRANFEPVPV